MIAKLLAAAVISLLPAAQPTLTRMTFRAARAAAERAAPDVRIAERSVDVARAEVSVAGALTNPNLTVTTSRESARLGASISIPIPVFGQLSKAVDAAERDRASVEIEVAIARSDARWNASNAWIALWEAEQRARQLTIGADEANKVAAIAEERFAAGSGPRLDVVRAAADRARARAEAEAQAAEIRSAAAKLAAWVGGDEPDALTADGDPEFRAQLPRLEDLEASLGEHPVLAHDRGRRDAAGAHVAAEERQRWPIINAELGVDAWDPGLPGTDLIGGVSLDVPFFNLRGGSIARAEAERSVAETRLDADHRRLRAELHDAYRRAEGAGIRVTALDVEVLPLIDEALQMTEEGYRDGRIDLLHVLDAAHTLQQARIERTQAMAALHHALADLEHSVGHALEGSEPNAL